MELREDLRKTTMVDIWSLKQEKEDLEKQKSDIDTRIKELEQAIDEKSTTLLEDMNSSNLDTFEDGDLVATKFSKDNVGYKDENEVINYLKENGYGKFVKVKESLDKTPLKKELKGNASLNEALNSMLVTTTTSYVVVTTKENTEKMFAHINENKESK